MGNLFLQGQLGGFLGPLEHWTISRAHRALLVMRGNLQWKDLVEALGNLVAQANFTQALRHWRQDLDSHDEWARLNMPPSIMSPDLTALESCLSYSVELGTGTIGELRMYLRGYGHRN